MALKIDLKHTPKSLVPALTRLWELSGDKILDLEKTWDTTRGAPVITIRGKYSSRGWTEWTEGFQYGCALLQFDATGEERFLELGRSHTLQRMAAHLTHLGVHDHGFNNISTYGNLLRLLREGRLDPGALEANVYELALKVSGALQAARWSQIADGGGYIYSFNGPHSLFVDTIRSLRSLAVAHQLGHCLLGEQDERISLLRRLLEHGLATARFSVYYGRGRDAYDLRGRTAHESIFNVNNGQFRCPNSQQGFSPFSTWTRGLAWALLGFAEQLQFLSSLPPAIIDGDPDLPPGMFGQAMESFLEAALATAEFYLEHCCTDGVPPWDTGAPQLHRLGDFLDRPSDPFNPWEPVDSSAAAIAAQGFLRLGQYLTTLGKKAKPAQARRYRQAGLSIAQTLFQEPYLATNPRHQGLLLHSVYHRPNGWDYVAPGQKVPNNESSLWGDYHLRELALMLWREARGEVPLSFFAATSQPAST